MVRDLINNKNGFTPGILIFSLGNIVNASYSVLEALTITTYSPSGFVPLEMSVGIYDMVRLASLTLGAWLMLIGGVIIVYATLKGK